MTGGQRLSPKRPMFTRKAERIPSRRPLRVRPNGRIVSVAVIVAAGVGRRRLTRRNVRSRWPTAALPTDWPRRSGFASRRASAKHRWRRRYVACSSAELLRAGLTGRIHLLRGLSRRLWWTGGVHAVVPSEIRRSPQVVTPHGRMNHRRRISHRSASGHPGSARSARGTGWRPAFQDQISLCIQSKLTPSILKFRDLHSKADCIRFMKDQFDDLSWADNTSRMASITTSGCST